MNIMDYSRFTTAIKGNKRLDNAVFHTRQLQNAAFATPDAISFCGGMPADDTYPFKKITFELLDGTQMVVDHEECLKMSPYQQVQGIPRLREWIKKIHRKHHNPPRIDDESEAGFDVAVTQGAAGGLTYLFAVLVEKDDVVLLEDYGFGATRIKVKMREADCLGMETDGLGIIPSKLSELLARLKKESRLPRIMVTNPNGQNPTGTICPMARKRQIYKIAQEYNMIIIEDDPYHYLQFSQDKTASYQSIDVDGRVLRVDSASKLVAPGVRIGWVTGPRAIVSMVVYSHISNAMGTSALSQMAMIKLMDEWKLDGFERRINYLSEKYKVMRDITVRACEKWLKDLGEWEVPEAGIYLWVKMSKTANSACLAEVENAKKWKVFVVPAIEYMCDTNSISPYFRVCFTRIEDDKIDEGIRRVAEFIRAHAD